MNKEQLQARLARELPKWSWTGQCITRTYRTSGWSATLQVTNAIAYLAEASWHHPDLEISWGHVVVRLTTHDAGGVTDKDIDLAHRMESLVLQNPGGNHHPLVLES